MTGSKQKIAPEEYRRILATLDLDRVWMEKGSFQIDRDILETKLNINISENYTYETSDYGITVKAKLKLTAEDSDKRKAVKVAGDFILNFSTPETISPDFFEIYKDISLPFIIWPFFREYAYSITSRMHIEPLTLPQIHQ